MPNRPRNMATQLNISNSKFRRRRVCRRDKKTEVRIRQAARASDTYATKRVRECEEQRTERVAYGSVWLGGLHGLARACVDPEHWFRKSSGPFSAGDSIYVFGMYRQTAGPHMTIIFWYYTIRIFEYIFQDYNVLILQHCNIRILQDYNVLILQDHLICSALNQNLEGAHVSYLGITRSSMPFRNSMWIFMI